jgi:hypothetical protein
MLLQMGITQLGVRKKILDAIRETHKRNWETSSLASIQYNKKIRYLNAFDDLMDAYCRRYNVRFSLRGLSRGSCCDWTILFTILPRDPQDELRLIVQ